MQYPASSFGRYLPVNKIISGSREPFKVMECMQQEVEDFQGVSLELETDTADSQTLEVPSPDVDSTADRQSTTAQTDRAETRVAEVQTEYRSTPPPFLSIEALQLDPPLLHYYTGLETHQKFTAVFNTLGPAVNHLRYLPAQRASFSTYKNTNTVKAVVGATLGGLISYISATYGGSTSDHGEKQPSRSVRWR
ncbi:uncharacterized protein [Littorina saxatilis]|uniref:uncharacterized protein n=1 Tax=Littorina saxatilis TaxID=31220 RepID=UPI0038B52CD6